MAINIYIIIVWVPCAGMRMGSGIAGMPALEWLMTHHLPPYLCLPGGKQRTHWATSRATWHCAIPFV